MVYRGNSRHFAECLLQMCTNSSQLSCAKENDIMPTLSLSFYWGKSWDTETSMDLAKFLNKAFHLGAPWSFHMLPSLAVLGCTCASPARSPCWLYKVAVPQCFLWNGYSHCFIFLLSWHRCYCQHHLTRCRTMNQSHVLSMTERDVDPRGRF